MMAPPIQDDYTRILERTKQLSEEIRQIAEAQIARYRAALARQEAEQQAAREGQ